MTVALFIHYTGWFSLTLGAFFVLSAAVGLMRFPDFFSRIHPAGMADSIGAPLMFIGIALLQPAGFITLKIILLIVFSLVTSATACHALAKAAMVSNEKPKAHIKSKKKGKA
jgi:multicomponent Na+:H+ antiporter subunit G